jgi:hypothetical protein
MFSNHNNKYLFLRYLGCTVVNSLYKEYLNSKVNIVSHELNSPTMQYRLYNDTTNICQFTSQLCDDINCNSELGHCSSIVILVISVTLQCPIYHELCHVMSSSKQNIYIERVSDLYMCSCIDLLKQIPLTLTTNKIILPLTNTLTDGIKSPHDDRNIISYHTATCSAYLHYLHYDILYRPLISKHISHLLQNCMISIVQYKTRIYNDDTIARNNDCCSSTTDVNNFYMYSKRQLRHAIECMGAHFVDKKM